MTFLHAIVLGVIEGITEFLPISSTAHLILASRLLHLPETEFQKTFEIAIQLGAILSVVVLYGRAFLRRDVLLRLLVAFIPTGIIGLLLHGVVRRYLLGNVAVVLWALFLGGLALILFEYWHPSTRFLRLRSGSSTARSGRASHVESSVNALGDITFTQALLVGLFQSIAIVPGVSRSAATIVGGLLLGIRRKTIVDFSFLLAVPTMAAATMLDLLKTAGNFSAQDAGLLGIGFAVSFLVALASIVWFLRFIRAHSFALFGIYRIALVVVAVAVFSFL